MSSLHISISAEPVFHLGPLVISNSIILSLLASGILIFVAFKVSRNLKNTGRPSGLQNLCEMIIEAFYNLANNITENRTKTMTFFPFVMTAFLWILINNWLGLLPGVGTIGFREPTLETKTSHTSIIAPPVMATEVVEKEEFIHGQPYEVIETGGEVQVEPESNHEITKSLFIPYLRAGTADLNTTVALAIMSVFLTQIYGLKYVGVSYLSKFFNLKGIYAFVGFLEFVGEFSKIISFAFRLFGNIFAGEVLLAVIAFIGLQWAKFVIPGMLPLPFYFLEIFVGVIQALVFSLLSLVFMNMATQSHAEDH